MMGIRDFDRPGHWTLVQERLDCRIVDDLMKRREHPNVGSAEGGTATSTADVGRAIPFKCDFTDMAGARSAAQEVWNIVADRHQRDSSRNSMVGAITHYVGTVGVGFDRPMPKGNLVSRYTENDDGIEYQLGINAINPFIFTLLVWPLLARTTGAAAAASVDGRIILTNSIANAWNTLPLAVIPQYHSWQSLKDDGERRWAAGRYNFSKVRP
jgi:NAD(P)-dependent dehydrogenase (short-subunit alcohol dehydrogenase family)